MRTETLGRRLFLLRVGSGLTQQQLADGINAATGKRINKSMISRWENNAGTPTMLNGEDVKDFIDDVSTQLFIGTSYLAKVTDHEFENGTEITVPFD